MKKTVSIITLLFILLGSVTSMAATKSDVKAAKQKAKELKGEGWKTEGATTIENGMIKIAEMQADGYDLLVGTSYGSQKPNVAKTKARNNAINEFAEYGKSIVKARIDTKVDDIDETEVDNLVSGYERMAIRELDDLMPIPTLVLRRETANGKFDYQCYYLIDSNTLRKAQKNALDKALENAGMAAQYAGSISDFVNEGFNEK
ncbi:MAG: hypothetical protein K2G90_00320 [Muribaculaceae bacterium]|nr:hypothetical protein [Muribaculaceae bacterium]